MTYLNKSNFQAHPFHLAATSLRPSFISILEFLLRNPPKPHAFVSLPLQSKITLPFLSKLTKIDSGLLISIFVLSQVLMFIWSLLFDNSPWSIVDFNMQLYIPYFILSASLTYSVRVFIKNLNWSFAELFNVWLFGLPTSIVVKICISFFKENMSYFEFIPLHLVSACVALILAMLTCDNLHLLVYSAVNDVPTFKEITPQILKMDMNRPISDNQNTHGPVRLPPSYTLDPLYKQQLEGTLDQEAQNMKVTGEMSHFLKKDVESVNKIFDKFILGESITISILDVEKIRGNWRLKTLSLPTTREEQLSFLKSTLHSLTRKYHHMETDYQDSLKLFNESRSTYNSLPGRKFPEFLDSNGTAPKPLTYVEGRLNISAILDNNESKRRAKLGVGASDDITIPQIARAHPSVLSVYQENLAKENAQESKAGINLTASANTSDGANTSENASRSSNIQDGKSN